MINAERVDNAIRWTNPGLRDLVIQLLDETAEEAMKLEREACAQIAEKMQEKRISDGDDACRMIANIIRQRGE